MASAKVVPVVGGCRCDSSPSSKYIKGPAQLALAARLIHDQLPGPTYCCPEGDGVPLLLSTNGYRMTLTQGMA